MMVGGPDIMWFAEPGIVHGEGTFVFRVFTWVDSRASYLAQESGDDTTRVSPSWPLSGAVTVQVSSISKITHLDCPQT